jgi:hypothetical protein
MCELHRPLADNVPMPPRPTWKGYLKVSLVTIPIKVFPATESAAPSRSTSSTPSADAHPAEALVPALRA